MCSERKFVKLHPSETHRSRSISKYALAIAATSVALAASALMNRTFAKNAERNNPPIGRFMTIEGVSLHYLDRGVGEAVVLLHGNGTMLSDFMSSGLIDLVAQNHRVIAFDRPGFGYSSRPADTLWTLLHRALQQIGIQRAKIFGHSWGTLVAIALALRHPESVVGLILASGFFYPKPRADVLLLSGPAAPGVGNLLCHTISPMLGRVMWPAIMRKIFSPARIPAKFRSFPKEMALRPSQLQASAAETALMIPRAAAMQEKYSSLKMPVTIIAGEGDRLVDTEAHSGRLHRALKQSKLRLVSDAGHMVHQTATLLVMKAINDVEHIESGLRVSREAA
jgi:pimeloyl-ACP methyl ester carboxylesterase